MPRKPKDITGEVFGYQTAVKRIGSKLACQGSSTYSVWLCRCICENEHEVTLNSLIRGTSKSCGCKSKELRMASVQPSGFYSNGRRHYLATTHTTMKQRCLNPNAANYHIYGGRGISVCDRWVSGENGRSGFECFVEDMGRRPTKQHTIDRIDNDGDYTPENCRWASKRQQSYNRSVNKYIKVDGERMCVAKAARQYGMKPEVVRSRISRGWPVIQALTKPLQR